jgi:hypothetical protein
MTLKTSHSRLLGFSPRNNEMFLAEVMPKKSATDRLKVWGEFITWKMRNAKQAIGEHKEAGVPKPKTAAAEFQEWAPAERKRKASEKARKASYARRDKTPKNARGQKKPQKRKRFLSRLIPSRAATSPRQARNSYLASNARNPSSTGLPPPSS